MKKRLLTALLCVAMTMSMLVGCSSGSDEKKADAVKEETGGEDIPVVRVACTPYSGHILDAIASAKGFYEDEKVKVELYFTHMPSDAEAALMADQVDILSTYGTNAPLQSVAAGNDVTIFAGYMLEGDTAFLAKEGTVINGVEDFIGKKMIGTPTNYAILGPLMDMGYDPHTDIEWVQGGDPVTNAEMILKGEADICGSTTGFHTQAKELGLTDVYYPDDATPEYSCCRVYAKTDWLNENKDATVRVLKAWMRAQEVLERDPDFAVEQVVAQTDLTEEYVENFIKSPHFMIRLDPHWKAVSNAWNWLARLDGLGEDADTSIDTLKEHFDITLYKQALDECVEQYYDEAPEYYDYYQNYYEEVNAELLN